MPTTSQTRNRSATRAYTLLWLLLFVPHITASKVSDIKEILETYDYEFLSDYTIHATAAQPTHLSSDQEYSTHTLTLSGFNGEHALRMNRTSLGLPVHRENSKYGDNDEEGNFIIAQNKNRHIWLGQSTYKILTEPEILTISRENVIVSDPVPAQPQMCIYPPGHQDAANLYYRYVMALGRGYSQVIDKVLSVSQGSEEISYVTAKGSLFSPNSGVWELEVEPKRNYLIRRASFRPDHATVPSFECESGVYLDGVIPVYQRGQLSFSGFVISVDMQSYSRTAETDFIDDASSRLNNVSLLQPDTLIMDFNFVDGDGVPLAFEAP